MRTRTLVLAPLGVVAALVAACVNAPISRPLAAGDCRAAITAFSSDARAQNDPDALRLVARAYATPDCNAWAPESALMMLARATEIDSAPSRGDRRLEGLLRNLIGDRERLRATIATQQRLIELQEVQLATLRAERDLLVASASRDAEYVRSLQARVAELEATLEILRAQVQALSVELEALKQVDLRGRPEIRSR